MVGTLLESRPNIPPHLRKWVDQKNRVVCYEHPRASPATFHHAADVDVTGSQRLRAIRRLPAEMITLIVGIRQRREQAVARAPVVLVLVTANGTHVRGACVTHQDEAALCVAPVRRRDAPLAFVDTPLLRSRPQCFSLGALRIPIDAAHRTHWQTATQWQQRATRARKGGR